MLTASDSGHALFLLTETVVSRRYAALRSRRPMWSPTIFEKGEQQLSRCTQIPELRLFVFNPFPGFNCIVTALKSRTVAHNTRTRFLLKFVRDISTKMRLSSFRASVSIRESSTNNSADSGFKSADRPSGDQQLGAEAGLGRGRRDGAAWGHTLARGQGRARLDELDHKVESVLGVGHDPLELQEEILKRGDVVPVLDFPVAGLRLGCLVLLDAV